ncbi:MAG: type III-A CRISPR-associated RAMP protein Csm4 [Scytonema sp. RU_4_4]|nr:type III-A CRISPR-associated RAMP protein Csm4 [Scytonema sp. RU_4_4]
MSIWKLVRLNFGQSGAHFGELGIGIEETSERVHSDTLFSALITVYAQLFGSKEVTRLLEQFKEQPGHPPFRLSSTFLYQQDADNIIDYLPKPLQFPCGYPSDDLEFFKTYKNLKHLPVEVWRRWYQGDGFTSSGIDSDRYQLIQKTQDKPRSNGMRYEAGIFSYSDGFKKVLYPKIGVDRITRGTNLYHTGFVQFNYEQRRQSGLYFLIQFPQANENLEANLKLVLRFLGDEGLGGERTSGAGQFQEKWFDFSKLTETWQKVLTSPPLTHYALISLFWESPLSENLLEIDGSLKKDSSYELQRRGGWISSPSGRQLMRKSIQMFTEGSVFPSQPIGQLADVTPDEFKQYRNTHKIYRSGVSLSLPIKLPNK